MKKKKLSEVSVNATTLNGQPASYYNHRMSGLGINIAAVTPVISDFNEELDTGFYPVNTAALNGPANIPSGAVLLNFKRTATYTAQIVIGRNFLFTRSKYNGTWEVWVSAI